MNCGPSVPLLALGTVHDKDFERVGNHRRGLAQASDDSCRLGAAEPGSLDRQDQKNLSKTVGYNWSHSSANDRDCNSSAWPAPQGTLHE